MSPASPTPCFGFTHCPYVCPTTLFTISEQFKKLGPTADKLKVFFVSVGPKRDTREQLDLSMTSSTRVFWP